MLDYTPVNMGMICFGKTPEKLGTLLGSCIGLALYDKKRKIGALAHIMLPLNENINESTAEKSQNGKYADTAINEMVKYLRNNGVCNGEIEAKFAGGAEMFSIKKTNAMKIGKRNEEAVKQILREKNIRIVNSDTGGNTGRKIIFDLNSFTFNIYSSNNILTKTI